MSVAIAGAGLSGLCLAQSLVAAGIGIRLYEADSGPFMRRQGYRITVDQHGIAALRQCLSPSLMALALATASRPGGYFRFTNSDLRDAVKLKFDATPDSGRQMDRQVLRSVLLVGLEDRVHYGKTAVAVESAGGDLVLRFADRTAARASVVVGADGIGSVLRRQIVPGAEPVNTNIGGIYGCTALVQHGDSVLPDALGKSGVLAIAGTPGRAVFFTSMRFHEPPQEAFARLAPGHCVASGDDYVMWGMTLIDSEMPTGDAMPGSAALQSHAAHLASSFHPIIRRLISTADRDATIFTRFAVGRRPDAWPLPRTTLIGDAIHAMPPFGAHGGNTALRDAALLGQKIIAASSGETSIESALSAYQNEMLPYAFKAVDNAAKMMHRLTSTNPLPRWLLLKLLPRLHGITIPGGQ
jgi:2-polyprenyl-6-methoxyphenol hydroxylase-like FAD-dependent oxidoreductase